MTFNTLFAYFTFGCTSAAMLLLMALLVRRLADKESTVWFSRFLWSLTLWALADVLELVGPSERWSEFWYGTTRCSAISLAAISWVWFCLAYCGCAKRPWAKIVQAVTTVVGFFFALLAWTPGRDYLFSELTFQSQQWLWEPVQREVGPWYDFYFAYGVACSLGGLVLLVVYVFRTGPCSRWQILTVSSAVMLSSAIAILSGSGRLGLPMLDKTVFVLPITVMTLAVSLWRLGFLQANPLLLNTLINTIPDGILALDSEGYLVEANQAGLQLTEHDRAFHGSPLFRKIGRVFSPGTAFGDLVNQLEVGRHEVTLQDQTSRRVYCVDIVELRGRKSSQGTLLVFRDETTLRQSLEDLDAYSYRVAHDLKNPLCAIRNFAVLIGRESSPEASQDMCNSVVECVDSMSEIINELLLVAAIRDGDQAEFSSVDVASLAHAVTQRNLNEQARIQIEERENWPQALGRAAWVEEILTNLIANALEHATEHQAPGEARIVLQSRKLDGFVEYSVSDNGPGMEDEQAEQLFAQRAPRLSEEGPPRGFGLSIARRLVEKQGGALGVRSVVGEGSTFWFTLHIAD